MLKVNDKVQVKGREGMGVIEGFEKPGIHTLAVVKLSKRTESFRLANVKKIGG